MDRHDEECHKFKVYRPYVQCWLLGQLVNHQPSDQTHSCKAQKKQPTLQKFKTT